LLRLDVNVISILKPPAPFAAKFAEMSPIALFPVTQVFEYLKVCLGTQVFHFNLKRPQEIAAQPRVLLQSLENPDGLLEFLVKQK